MGDDATSGAGVAATTAIFVGVIDVARVPGPVTVAVAPGCRVDPEMTTLEFKTMGTAELLVLTSSVKPYAVDATTVPVTLMLTGALAVSEVTVALMPVCTDPVPVT